MNDLMQTVSRYPDMMLVVKSSELLDMVRFCVLETKKSIEQQLVDASVEKYLSPRKTAEMLDVNLSTLWRWQKQNYLSPIELGGKRKYRQSEIDRILKKGVVTA